jgi:adenosine deaminase
MAAEPLSPTELHCHLIGVIDAALLRRVAAAGHPVLVDPAQVLPAARVTTPATFLDWLASLGPYRTAGPDAYLPILADHVDSLLGQGVRACEVTLSPTMFPGPLDDALAAFAAFVAASRALERGRIAIDYLAVIPRRLPEAAMARDTAFCRAAHRAGLLIGVAVAGLDYDLPLDRLTPMLTALKDAGLGIEIHTGEHTPPAEVAAVLDRGLADRIGHGVRAFEDAALVRRLARSGVHLEFCPTSNLATGVVASAPDLPIRRALDAGVRFSINTDDPGAFGCTVASEYALVADAAGLGPADLAAIATEADAARFGRRPASETGDTHNTYDTHLHGVGRATQVC